MFKLFKSRPERRFRVLYAYAYAKPKGENPSVSVLLTKEESQTYFEVFKDAFEIVEVVAWKEPDKRHHGATFIERS